MRIEQHDPPIVFLTTKELESLLKKEKITGQGLTIHMQEVDSLQFVELFAIINLTQKTIEMIIETGYYNSGEFEIQLERKTL